jgi:ATP-binding cassette subfamily F protein 3
MVPRLRDLLGAFLFAGDAVGKRTSVLSGGERNRLALAKLLVRSVNCLLLDEPTNHLDMHAKDVLVSHDRYILDALPQCVIEVGHGRAVRYLGNYEAYLQKKAAEEAARTLPPLQPPRAAKPVRAARAESPKPAKKPSNGRNGLDPTRLTEEIARFEEEQSKLSEELSRPNFYMTHPDPNGLIARYAELKQQVDDLYRKLGQALAEG